MAKVLGWKYNICIWHKSESWCSNFFLKQNVEIVNKYVDSKGHWIILVILVDKVRYTLVNIYIPNTDDVTFFQDIHFRV